MTLATTSPSSFLAHCLRRLPIFFVLCAPLVYAQSDKTEPIELEISIAVNNNVNPDDKSRPQPIELRVYELKENQAFEGFDYFALYGKDKEILGADLIKKDGFLLRPGDEKKIFRKADTQTKFIGVLASYRELGKTVWRGVQKLPEPNSAGWLSYVTPSKKAKLKILLEEYGLRLVETE